jgi:hypothetical protein
MAMGEEYEIAVGMSQVLSATEWKYVLLGIQMATNDKSMSASS